jgi:NADH pyrophosphatase NudC (nudix superfamily)
MAGFLEKIKEGIDKGVTTVTAKSKEVVETTQIRSQLRPLRKQKQDALRELGAAVYAMARRNEISEERIRDRCEGIGRLDDRIREKEEELRRLHQRTQEAIGHPRAVRTCVCGAKMYEGMRYCPNCGRKAPEPPAGDAGARAEEIVCSRCGTPVPPDGSYCPGCGGSVGG